MRLFLITTSLLALATTPALADDSKTSSTDGVVVSDEHELILMDKKKPVDRVTTKVVVSSELETI